MKHTPTPWEFDKDGCFLKSSKCHKPYIQVPCGFVRNTASTTDEQANANAQHIVKCVNNHDTLVSCLSGTLGILRKLQEDDNTGATEDYADEVETFLKQIKEQ